jgi:hypothetical protein
MNIAELAGATASLAERSIVDNVRGSSVVSASIDRFRYARDRATLVLYREYYTEGRVSWRPRALKDVVEGWTPFRGNNVSLNPATEQYSRGGAGGEVALFTYKEGQVERSCTIAFFALSGAGAERITSIYCPPAGRLDMATEKRIADSIGSKRHPALIAAAAPPPRAPAASAPTPGPAATGSNAPVTGSAADRLRSLKDLFDQKLITQAEYEQKRKAILDGF